MRPHTRALRAAAAALLLALAIVQTACPEWRAEGTVVAVDIPSGTVQIRTRRGKVRTYRTTQGMASKVLPRHRVKFGYSDDKLTWIETIGWDRSEDD